MGWMKWLNDWGGICGRRKIPHKVKGEFYHMHIRPTMLYETKCWVVKSQQESKLSVAKMSVMIDMQNRTIIQLLERKLGQLP